jgi:hypothetical protein
MTPVEQAQMAMLRPTRKKQSPEFDFIESAGWIACDNTPEFVVIESAGWTACDNSINFNIDCTRISTSWDDNTINPATGLLMIGGTGGIDVGGNPFGTNFDHHDDSLCGWNDTFNSNTLDSSFTT